MYLSMCRNYSLLNKGSSAEYIYKSSNAQVLKMNTQLLFKFINLLVYTIALYILVVVRHSSRLLWLSLGPYLFWYHQPSC